MQWGVDSSSAPADPKALVGQGFSFAMGYLPALPGQATPHVWTADEWKACNDAGLKLGPIAVAPYGTPTYQQGVDAGNFALASMQDLKLSGIFVLDIENGYVATDYALGVVAAAHAGQCSVALYGAQPTIYGMAQQAGSWFWDRTWLCLPFQNGQRVIRAFPDFDMWQFGWTGQFDYDVAVNDFPFASLAQ